VDGEGEEMREREIEKKNKRTIGKRSGHRKDRSEKNLMRKQEKER
jgi:hypothetical protein